MADKYTLFGDYGSGSATVELTMAELEIPYQFQEIALESENQHSDSYQKLNPHGKIPTLINHDGILLTESVAILLWLLETHPDNALMPPLGSRTRADVLRWLLFIAADLYQLIEIYDYPERFVSTSNAEGLRQKVTEKWQKRWLLVEDNIVGPYLLGDKFSIADIYIAVVSRWADQGHWRPHQIPKVERIAKLVASRPLCKTVWDRNFPS